MAGKYGYMAKIGADTSGLTAALSDAERSLRNTSAELKAVNEGLKLEGGENAENLTAKFKLLESAIEDTKAKLEGLKSVEQDVNNAAGNGDISSSALRQYQNEVNATESSLRQYEQLLKNTQLQLDNLNGVQQESNDTMQSSAEIADLVHRAMERYTGGSSSAASAAESESDALDDVAESAGKASAAMEKVVNVRNVQYDTSAIDYIENYGKAVETTATAYDKYKASSAEVDDAIKKLTTEYGQLDKALAANADSEVLALQKKQVKSELIETERLKLEKLENQYKSMRAAVDSGDIGAEQFREFEREIEATKQKLEELTRVNGEASDSTEELGDSAKELGNEIDNAGKKAASFGDIFKANVLSDVVMSGIRKLKNEFVDFAKEGINLASDLTEVQNVVDVTFGGDASTIDSWAKQAATSFGMSELAAKQYTGTLGAMLKSQGITSDSVTQLSTDLVGLAGDMASFYNIDVETAFEKIRSGISGETEPLKQLGINMSVANMEAFALAEGIEKPWKKMSQQEQTILRYQYLLQQTTDAQGDFARTSDSYANQQRIMQLTLQNLSAELGEKLLPVAMEFTQMISESAPNIMNSIVDIGSAAATVAQYLIEHREAVISLVTAYGTFKGAVAVGSAVTGAINAYKSLTAATQAATVAQEANNAAAAANPYVLLISAIVAAGVAIGSYVMQLDSAIEKEKDIKKAADETRASADAEARTVEMKAERYRRLYEEYKKTGVATSEMNELAKELQALAPDTISLIDEETGAYKELSDSIDDVIKNIRLKGIEEARSNSLNSYYDNITKYYEKQAKAYQDYSEKVSGISDETLAEIEKGSEGAYGKVIELLKDGADGIEAQEYADANGLDYSAFETYQNAQYGLHKVLDKTNEKIAEQEELITQTSESFDKMAEALNGVSEAEPTSSWGDYYKKQSEEAEASREAIFKASAADVTAYEEQLQTKVDALDKSLALRKISEEEYYTELKKYLDENVNTESEAYYKQLSNYEKFIDDRNKKAEQQAEKEKQEREQQAEQAKKDADEQVEAKIDAIKLKNELDDSYTDAMMYDDIEVIVNSLDKRSDLYKKYNEDLLKGRKKLSDELIKEEKEAAEAEINAWEDAAKEKSKVIEDGYKEIVKEKEKAKNELLSIDLSDTVTDKDGNDKEILTDLDAETKKIDRYLKTLDMLKSKGASDSLIEKIQSMNYDDGSRQSFIDTLLSLSDAGWQQYMTDWANWQAKAEEASQSMVSDDLETLNQKTADAVDSIFGDLPASAYEDGAKTAQSYLQGIIDNMGDLNDINTIQSILGYTSGGAGQNTVPPGGNNGNGSSGGTLGGIDPKTTIVINLNDKEYITMALEDLIASGKRTGGNTFGV